MIFSSSRRVLSRGGRRFARAACIGAALLLGDVARSQDLPPPSELKQLSLTQLLDFEVTSVSRRPQKLSETASAIQVITGDDVRRSGATDLAQALRLASNLEVDQIDSRQWAISARGFNNVFADKMLVLIDGRTVYTPLYAGVYWDVQHVMLEDLDRIEVISGPGATQWGANAVNGVINVTTKPAVETQGALVVEGAGTNLRNDSELRYGGALGREGHFRVYAQHLDHGDSERLSGAQAGDAWQTNQLGFRADWGAPGTSALTLQGDAYVGRMGQRGADDTTANGQNVLGRWARQLATGDFKVQTYFDRTHRRIPGSFAQNIETYDFDFQHHLPWRSHDLLWGFGYRLAHDEVVNTPANAFLPANVTHEWFNGFVQDEIAVIPHRWHVTAGTKFEHNDYTGFEIEPSLRSAWTPDTRQTLWAAVSRAVRTPSRIDRDLYSPAAPPYRIAGGPNVVSEKLIAYELGYRWQFAPELAASIAAFHHDYDDLRSIEPLNAPDAFPVERTSGLRGQADGAELTADWSVTSRWRLHAGWTELRAHSEPQPGNLARPTRDSIVRDPHHWGALRSSFDLSPRLEFDADLRWVGELSAQDVPAYTELNVRCGWQLSNAIDLSLTGENLLHARHGEFNPPTARRYVGRGVFAKATWRF